MYTTLATIKKHLNIDSTFTDDDTYLTYLYDVAAATVARHICCVLTDLEDSNNNIPAPIVHAILLYIGDLYNSREGNAYGVTATQVPFTYDYLLSLYKNYGDTTSDEFEAKAIDHIAQGIHIDSNGDLQTDPAYTETKPLARIAQGLYVDSDGKLRTNTEHI